jgi:hypothetical protein
MIVSVENPKASTNKTKQTNKQTKKNQFSKIAGYKTMKIICISMTSNDKHKI